MGVDGEAKNKRKESNKRNPNLGQGLSSATGHLPCVYEILGSILAALPKTKPLPNLPPKSQETCRSLYYNSALSFLRALSSLPLRLKKILYPLSMFPRGDVPPPPNVTMETAYPAPGEGCDL